MPAGMGQIGDFYGDDKLKKVSAESVLSMLTLVRKSWLFFALLTAAAFALRFFFVCKFANWDGDPLFYGDLAKNWLQHGILGTTHGHACAALPDPPAGLSRLSGRHLGRYRGGTLPGGVDRTGFCQRRYLFHSCRLGAAWLCFGGSGGFGTHRQSCLCTGGSVSLSCQLHRLRADGNPGDLSYRSRTGFGGRSAESEASIYWAACGAAVGASILLRPDGGILLPVIGTYGLLRCLLHSGSGRRGGKRWSRAVLHTGIFAAVALFPLAPWTMRNWRDFKVFQPLAPRYANDPGQFVPVGFQRWVKSWIVNYASVSEIYWQLDEDKIDLAKAPQRAFNSPQERVAVSGLFAHYNASRNHDWTPELDGALNNIAGARIARRPWQYYLVLPLARIADMWLRPRTEMLGVDDRWWELAAVRDSTVAVALGVLNFLYVAAAAAGAIWLAGKACTTTGAQWRYWELGLAFLLNALAVSRLPGEP